MLLGFTARGKIRPATTLGVLSKSDSLMLLAVTGMALAAGESVLISAKAKISARHPTDIRRRILRGIRRSEMKELCMCCSS